MSLREPLPVHLRRIDPAQNMRRFYSLSVQPTLFGGASLIRDWGRIGTRGQTMMETFDTVHDADLAFDRLQRSKRRRGYRDGFGDQAAPVSATDKR
jgi:predicted DNA-binding WGR domain protein